MQTDVDTFRIKLLKVMIEHLNAVSKRKPVDPRISAIIVQKHYEITKLQALKPPEKGIEVLHYSLPLYCSTMKALEAVHI